MATSLGLLSPPQSDYSDDRYDRNTADYLEEASSDLLEIWNTHDWRHPVLDLLDGDDFRLTDQGKTVSKEKDNLVGAMQVIVRENPTHRVHVLNSTAKIDEAHGRATVFTTLRSTGYPHNNTYHCFNVEGLVVFYWQRRAGDWKCVKRASLRGPGWLENV